MPEEYSQTATGQAAEGGASGSTPVQLAGRFDAVARSVDDGDMVTVACDAAGRILLASGSSSVTVTGSDAEDAAVTAAPILIGGRFDATPRSLDDGDAGALALDVAGKALVVESSAADILTAVQLLDNIVQTEDAAAVTTPALMAGRFDSSARTLDDGDGGALALNASAHLLVVEGSAADILADTTAILADTADIQIAVELLDDIVHAEDSAHSSGHKGALILGVRNDELAALASTDGDYVPFQMDADGAVYTTPNTIGWTSVTAALATATSTEAVAAPGAGKAFVILNCRVQQNDPTPTAQLVALEEGTSGTERASFRLAANDGAGAQDSWIILAENQAINFDSDQASNYIYSMTYRTIDI